MGLVYFLLLLFLVNPAMARDVDVYLTNYTSFTLSAGVDGTTPLPRGVPDIPLTFDTAEENNFSNTPFITVTSPSVLVTSSCSGNPRVEIRFDQQGRFKGSQCKGCPCLKVSKVSENPLRLVIRFQ